MGLRVTLGGSASALEPDSTEAETGHTQCRSREQQPGWCTSPSRGEEHPRPAWRQGRPTCSRVGGPATVGVNKASCPSDSCSWPFRRSCLSKVNTSDRWGVDILFKAYYWIDGAWAVYDFSRLQNQDFFKVELYEYDGNPNWADLADNNYNQGGIKRATFIVSSFNTVISDSNRAYDLVFEKDQAMPADTYFHPWSEQTEEDKFYGIKVRMHDENNALLMNAGSYFAIKIIKA